MPELTRPLDGLLAKEEVTYGTDAAPVAGTDGVRISRLLWSNITLDYQWENARDDVANGSIIPADPALPRGRKARVEVFWEAKGAGIDAAPEARALFIACGLPETDGTAVFDYGPLTSGTKGSATLWCYSGNVLIKVVGCRGRFRWPLVVGERAIHQFTMYGLVTEDPATTALAAVSYDATEPLAGVNTALTIGAWTPDWLSGELDLTGVDPAALLSGNANEGIRAFDFGTSNPTFSLVARKEALATYNPLADLKTQTARTLAMTFGSVAFNRVGIVAASLKLRSHGFADSEDFVNYNLNFRVSSGGIIRFS